jgi:hypothetical protein
VELAHDGLDRYTARGELGWDDAYGGLELMRNSLVLQSPRNPGAPNGTCVAPIPQDTRFRCTVARIYDASREKDFSALPKLGKSPGGGSLLCLSLYTAGLTTTKDT